VHNKLIRQWKPRNTPAPTHLWKVCYISCATNVDVHHVSAACSCDFRDIHAFVVGKQPLGQAHVSCMLDCECQLTVIMGCVFTSFCMGRYTLTALLRWYAGVSKRFCAIAALCLSTYSSESCVRIDLIRFLRSFFA
jgi:hypothetical protein